MQGMGSFDLVSFYLIKEQNQPNFPPMSRPEIRNREGECKIFCLSFWEQEEETRGLELGAILELGAWVFLGV